MKKALVLAGGIPQIELIKELQEREYYVILADYYENPVAKPYADKFYRKSTLDVDAIRKICIEESVDMLITCCTDQALATVSLLSQELNLPCYINADVGLAVTNKQYMKEIFVQNNIPTAKFTIMHEAGKVDGLKYPLVIKPVDCNSSKGVVCVKSEQELNEAVNTAINFSRTQTAIVEEYIDGVEVSVDLFVCQGKAEILCYSFSDKIKNNNGFVIYRGQYPAKISEIVLKKIKDASQNIAEAFHLNNCPMLIQLLVKDEEIFVIEFSARTGGCVKYHMIELASGVDVIKTTVDVFEGKPITVNPVYSNNIIVNEFVYCKQGVYSRLEGIDECIDLGFLEKVFVLKKPGEQFEKVENSGDRIAALTYVAESYEDYVHKHNEVVARIKVIDYNGADMMRHDLLPLLKCKENGYE